MKDDTKIWLGYAVDNLEAAKILLQNNLYNPCLQNVQQAVEKALKAILVENAITFKKMHDILDLKYLLINHNININLSDDDCDFLNAIYLPSKYPLETLIADYDLSEERYAERHLKLRKRL